MQPKENKWLVLPEAIHPPAIDSHLEELNAVARSTECLRHFVLSIEFWISLGGRLRQWIKLNICLAAFLLIPAIFLIPVISLVLHELDGVVTVVTCIAWKLILLSTLVSVVVIATKHFPSSSPGSSRRRK